MPNGNRSLNLFFSKNNFLGSFNDIYKIPNADLPECCFVGRSNVGKSSIINAITKTKKLAKISKTPGRTQSINLFERFEPYICPFTKVPIRLFLGYSRENFRV